MGLTFPVPHFILANFMKSMLQDLGNNIISSDNLFHEQNGKLFEKDKVIEDNKAEILRLEKRTRVQEQKVRNGRKETSLRLLVRKHCCIGS